MYRIPLPLCILLMLLLTLSSCIQADEATPAIAATNSPTATLSLRFTESTPTIKHIYTRTATEVIEGSVYGMVPSATINVLELKEVNEGIETGNLIIQALEKYFMDKGVYPQSLNELIPEYLPSMPCTLSGNKFGYHQSITAEDIKIIGGPFILWFDLGYGRRITCSYASKFGWECSITPFDVTVVTRTPYPNETPCPVKR